jgi:hypothetical protein
MMMITNFYLRAVFFFLSISFFSATTMSMEDNLYLEKSICSDNILISLIQKYQINTAKDHIINSYFKKDELNKNATSIEEGVDVPSLFSHHFGTLEAEISDISSKKHEILVYYR